MYDSSSLFKFVFIFIHRNIDLYIISVLRNLSRRFLNAIPFNYPYFIYKNEYLIYI